MEQKLVVGAIAGIIGTSAIFPIDVVKTRLQVGVVTPLLFPGAAFPLFSFAKHEASECLSAHFAVTTALANHIFGRASDS